MLVLLIVWHLFATLAGLFGRPVRGFEVRFMQERQDLANAP
jgi:hypothetical protein